MKICEAYFTNTLIFENVIGSKYIILHESFTYYSDILKQQVTIPKRFCCDLESVPLFKASSKIGGVIHDYFCRSDSSPVVSKQVAADLYLEAQTCRDRMIFEGRAKSFWRTIKRHVKTLTVRLVPGYFHKFKVLSTLEDIRGY